MALEFASKKETFPKYKVFETELAGRPFVVETGKMCGLSNGSCLVRYGETAVLCNVTMSDKPRDGIDFFPLSVDFEEKLYSVGTHPRLLHAPRGPSRRKGHPDLPCCRPSHPSPVPQGHAQRRLCGHAPLCRVDQDCSPEIAGMIGTSIAISISDIPWKGPIAGVFVGLVDGELCDEPHRRAA